jgi:micrococcal nuclease
MKKNLLSVLILFVSVLPCFATPYKVLRVIDGDTIDIHYGEKKERIRLLNVDTPESVHPDKTRNTSLGKQASDYTKERLSGKFVSLEFEEKKRGKYGRLLAYVILDNTNFNLELVQNGWSPYYTKYGESKRYHEKFRSAQEQAQLKGVNIWIDPVRQAAEYKEFAVSPLSKPLATIEFFHGNTSSRIFHGPECRYFRCNACTKIFSSRNATLEAGYSPCQVCAP